MAVNSLKAYTNFNTGEISPNMYGRTDMEKYQSACEVLENWLILPQGGVENRRGLAKVSPTKGNLKSRLIPWEGGGGKMYMLEFSSDGSIRFLRNGVLVNPNTGELLTSNGGFDSNLSGWQNNSPSRVFWSPDFGGVCKFNHPLGVTTMSISLSRTNIATLTAGIKYYLKFDFPEVVLTTGVSAVFSVIINGGTQVTNYPFSTGQVRTGAYTIEFTPALTGLISIEFRMVCNQAGLPVFGLSLDNVSIQADSNPYAITGPYNSETLISSIQVVQKNEDMWLSCGSVHPQQLTRIDEVNWRIKDALMLPPPVKEEERIGMTSFTLSSTGIGISTLTFVSPGETIGSFGATAVNSSVGRGIRYLGGYGIVTACPTSTTCTLSILYPFPTNSVPIGTWYWDGSPKTGLTITKVGGTSSGGITQAPGVGEQATMTLAVAGWRSPYTSASPEVGKYVRANNGVFQITSVSSSTVATGICMKTGVYKTSPATPFYQYMDQVPGGAWELSVNSWGPGNYPTAVQIYEDRLVFGGNASQPSTIWPSATGDFSNFGIGTNDNEAMEFTISSQIWSQIRWLASSRVMVGGTSGGEFRISGSQDGPLVPSSVQARNETNFGVSNIPPQKINQFLLYWQRAKKKLMAMKFTFESDSYNADDLTVMADHIGGSGIVTMDFQSEPVPTLWTVRNDGVLAALTFIPEQKVFGWGRHTTLGVIEDIACIPSISEDRDILYCVVRRVINGDVLRFIEMIDAPQYLDCSVSIPYNSGGTHRVAHLPNTVVTVATTSLLVGTFLTDINGDFTISTVLPVGTILFVGLPYTCTLTTVAPEVPLKSGVSQGRIKKWSEVYARVRNTRGLKVNDEQFSPDVEYTEDIRADVVGLDQSSKITLVQAYPFPAKVLMIHGTLTIGD